MLARHSAVSIDCFSKLESLAEPFGSLLKVWKQICRVRQVGNHQAEPVESRVTVTQMMEMNPLVFGDFAKYPIQFLNDRFWDYLEVILRDPQQKRRSFGITSSLFLPIEHEAEFVPFLFAR